MVKHAKVQCESHIRTPENADYVVASGQADMVSHRARPDRRSASGQQGARGPRRGHPRPASPATRCAGAGATATTGSPAWSIPRPGASSNGAATASRQPRSRKRYWSSAAGRRAGGGARRGRARPSGDAWPRPPTSSAGSSAWPACSRAARRSSTTSTGMNASLKSCRSGSCSTRRSMPRRQRASVLMW